MTSQTKNHCHSAKKTDYLLWSSLIITVISYIIFWQFHPIIKFSAWLTTFTQAIYILINQVWWGIVIGIIMLSILSEIPKEFVLKILGLGDSFRGIVQATIVGILLDLCSHGILMVASKLYERGASTGQVMAFLIASPWNSFSLTIILITLIGLKWTLIFIFFSMLIAIISGLIFDLLVRKEILPENKNKITLPKDFHFFKEAKKSLKNTKFTPKFFSEMILLGIKESRMVIRWLLFGVILASIIKASINTESFQTLFGPTIFGLISTIFIATIIEVCSEGSTPIAADILTRAGAPGNSFAFLMTGVSTDYTEIVVLKDTTKSWKIALFLPLLTLPQIIIISLLINSL